MMCQKQVAIPLRDLMWYGDDGGSDKESEQMVCVIYYDYHCIATVITFNELLVGKPFRSWIFWTKD